MIQMKATVDNLWSLAEGRSRACCTRVVLDRAEQDSTVQWSATPEYFLRHPRSDLSEPGL